MNNQSNKKQNRLNGNLFLKTGFMFFLKANILLIMLIFTFLVNKAEWQYDGGTSVIMFVTFAELFIILLSVLVFIKPNVNSEGKVNEREQSKEWIGALIAFVSLSLFSLIFLGANIPYPSTLIFLILMTNFMVSLYSVVFHPVALGIYEANVFQEKTTMLDYIFKYIAIFLSGINYYVQRTLLKLPLLINKFIAVAFVLFLLWQGFGVIAIFDK
ncbi:hypothetical protein [Virgibacillus dakarensis]|uniref:hypothetical protein n=1 Tax=Virgibacillus dakarensis TaxID=1917889 RepID=UPI000B4300E2|nr:hypothetical protein [Virgibacillus dakarensis]